VSRARRLCFLVNPLAGIGGPLALKGSDGEAGWEALRRGAALVSPRRAERFARSLAALATGRVSGGGVVFYTAGGLMGASILGRHGMPYTVVYEPEGWPTTREDTIRLVEACIEKGVELVVFVGGDGTARDVVSVTGRRTPVLGVPSGVKMYSAVFAESPEAAALALHEWLEGRASLCDAEVLDIDEDAFRSGVLRVRLYGYARTVCAPGMVTVSKQPTIGGSDVRENIDAIARYIVEGMEDCTLYVLGPGTTLAAVAEQLGIEKTLLGVDVVHNRRLVARDVDEETLYRIVSRHASGGGKVRIIVTPIGGQGFILGRGNQQISPRVVRAAGGKRAVVVVSPRSKLARTPVLRVDTGDPSLDAEFSGYIRVVVDYGEEQLVRVSTGAGYERPGKRRAG